MNLKKWTTALTLCAVTFVATTAGIAPALAADDTAAVGNSVPNLQAAADAMNAATQQLNGGIAQNDNTAQQPAGYEYINLTQPAVHIDGQVYLPLRATFAAMKNAAAQIEWKPQNQQKIKIITAGTAREVYLTPGDTAIQLQQGGTTYTIKNQNGGIYVPLSFFQAIAQTADIQLSGNDMLVLRGKAGHDVWDPQTPFWYNMNTYQQPVAPQQQAQPAPQVSYPDVNTGNTNTNTTKPQQPVVPNVNVPNNTIGGKLVNNALQYLGVPYVWGGNTPQGFDCSGLVQYVYAQLGVSVPRTSYEQQAAATPISLVALQPGDLVFWGASAYHVGIYIGDGKYVHAPVPGQNVKIQSFDEYPYTGAGRILV